MASSALALLACAPALAQSQSQSQPDAGRGAAHSAMVVGDAMPAPLTSRAGDADNGRRIVADRQLGLCLLCHSAPIAEVRFQGNLATDLAGAGSRWSEGQLRLRLVDPQRLNPESIMPAYFRVDGLTRVGTAWRGKPVLQAQQIEDLLAYLRTLRAAP